MVIINSIGKALGVPGGIILGRSGLLDQFRKSSFYTASSPITPAYLYGFMQIEQEVTAAMDRLSHNILFFKQHIPGGITNLDYDYPVFLLKDDGIADYCLEKRILLSSFPYPNPDDANLTRIVLNAWHTEEDLLYLIDIIKSFYGIV